MIAEPLSAGAVHETLTVPSPLSVAATAIGESGTVDGVTALDALLDAPSPFPLVAVTVKVYESPSVSPETKTDRLVLDVGVEGVAVVSS